MITLRKITKKRKYLSEQLKAAREKNYIAKIRKNVLIVNGEEYSYEDLKNNEQLTEIYKTPEKTVSSAPATPSDPESIFNYPPQLQEKKIRNLEETPAKPTGTKSKKFNTRSQVQKNIQPNHN